MKFANKTERQLLTEGLALIELSEAFLTKGQMTVGTALLIGKKLTEDPDCGFEGTTPERRFAEWIKQNVKPHDVSRFDENNMFEWMRLAMRASFDR